ncbi:MAG: hypothetical protein M1290_06410 [Candidatus Thermoplasmatota archaeon]|jgi:hypothetical protein|nr:hypothetical protein [Candidatus Thermoplasmatota archaeon]MCL5790076.1 hypothetical protein [Candidatus Thermoplasmatota archaeon]
MVAKIKSNEDLESRRRNVGNALAEFKGNIVQLTYRNGEGRKMVTDDFMIVNLSQDGILIDRTVWNESKWKVESAGHPFLIKPESVHVIVSNNEVIFPLKSQRKKRGE